ncbi:hypothetical protein K493DRAFT_307895 [Basidiobolus meristosporus CBS 931.73]|uniref:Uncharacterized protein n=1 Tax=Basidiobolus meristosporus CBS 931.73 TaxID=1314790 RepID=A0A1Y1X8N3_9FUNG|nr:hypothetical protein K493DRAFT_307895 [Basidiobolus meristosporus CBS 931.73]|eukprot:ORX82121.1 hypothetical protein K493DRAFT_307895 [Basidiobolus meristosporus CBS 931.73]
MTPLLRQNTRELWVPVGKNNSIHSQEVAPIVVTAELAFPEMESRLSGRPSVDHLCKYATNECLHPKRRAATVTTEYTSFPHHFDQDISNNVATTVVNSGKPPNRLEYTSFPAPLTERSATEPVAFGLDHRLERPERNEFRTTSLPDLHKMER